ncbi:MAG TPA: cobalt-precorrin-7 (C(5))-methyltransferase, partial [Candidatus Methanoperedenaceae archaeon]|nr:cobalt-precorrin-7 (C(5))-methyltransferase [Candidatus Methanoperedenaceae archaeon]
MKIVGVGVSKGMLTEEATSVIKSAKVIFGSKRAIAIASPYIKSETHEIDFKHLDEIPDDAVVLSTGDPMLSGLGALLDGEIIPGIS